MSPVSKSRYVSPGDAPTITTGGAPLPDEWANIHWMTKNIATVETVARDAATESNPKEE